MKETPPPPGPVKNLEFPEIPATVLDNGLRLVSIRDDYLPRVSIFLGFPSGRMHDPEGRRGLTQLMADMLKEGTAMRSSRQIAEAMDRYALDVDCRVSLEYTVVQFKLLENFVEEAMELLSEIIYQASFPAEEWTRAAVRWKGHLASQKSNPSYLARERIYRELFPGSPLANCSVDPSTIDLLEPGEFSRFHGERFCPSAGLIGFAGPLPEDKAAGLAGRYLGRSGPRKLALRTVPEVPGLQRRICLIHRPGSHQAKIMVGIHAPARKKGLNLPLKVMNQVFGGGGSSRIFMNLREARGYTYGAYSYLRQSNYAGACLVSTSVNNSAAADSIREIFREMDRMRQDEVSGEELERCKAEINGTFLRQMETPSSICSMELTRRLVDLPDRYYHEFIPALMEVDPGQVRAEAESVLDPDKAVVVVVGDRDRIGRDLEALGPVS